MWKSFFTGLLTVAVAFQVYAQPARPKLFAGLMVDQMRWVYLYRFANRYGDDGFKCILNEGCSCKNTLVNFIPTVTAIGQTSGYTGSVTAIHGIAGNDWIIQATGPPMNCTHDDKVQSVGPEDREGQQS